MSRIILFLAIVVAMGSIACLGCHSDPTSPDPGLLAEQDNQPSESSSGTRHSLGFYFLAFDAANGTIEVLSGRSTEWHFNLTGVLNGTMGVSAAMVPGESDPGIGLFVLDITLAHPFGTEPQLAGFDVKGILITPGALVIGPLVLADVDETRLENADGYTRWWNPTEFTEPGMLGYTEGNLALGPTSALTATVNPYKLFADILGAEDGLALVSDEPLDNNGGRAVFTAGSSNTRRYRIIFPMAPGPQVIFGYAIDCAWNPPDPNPPDWIPDDFPIEANQPEAYRVDLVPTVNTLFYDSEEGVGGGVLRLQIVVHDWQGQAAGDIPGEISVVNVFAPDLMASGADGVFLSSTPIKATYTADLTDLAVPTEAGETLVICRIGSSDGTTYQQTVAPAPDVPLSAYQIIPLEVPDPVCSADSNNVFADAVEMGFGELAADQVCHTDDSLDYYYFSVPLGFAPIGEIRLYSAPDLINLALYDESEDKIADVPASGSLAAIDLDKLNLMPGTYFLEVEAGGTDAVLPYLLELDAELQNVVPASPVEVTPSTLFVDPDFVWIHDDYAYLVGDGIWVYDVSTAFNPVQISWDLGVRFVRSACFSYPYCYLIHWVSPEFQLGMIDFSDPSAPVLHEEVIQLPSDFADITMNSTHLYVGTSVSPNSEVIVYDYISDPLSPIEVGSVTVPYEPQILSLLDPEGPETHLVVGTWDDIFTFDVENPLAITATGTYNFPVGAPRDIATWEDYIYVGHDATSGGEGWLYVLQQTTVPDIQQKGMVDVPGAARHVGVNWPYVHVGDGEAGLTVCDVTTPTSPSVASTTGLVSRGGHLAVEGNIVYIILMDAGLQVMDVSMPGNPSTLSRLRVVNNPGAMRVKDDYLIVTESEMWHYAIKTVDISEPSNARVAGEHFLSDSPRALDLHGDILATNTQGNWWLFDASDPLSISLISITPESETIRDLAVWGDAIYVATNLLGTDSVQVYDISNPSVPIYKNTLVLSTYPRGFGFHSDFMYITTTPGVEVYSLADPFNPSWINTYILVDTRRSLVHGDFLYLITPDSLEIADISTPSAPVHMGSTAILTPSELTRISVEGLFAYLAVMDNPTYSAWIWPPDAPGQFGLIYTSGDGGEDLIAHQGFLYQATEDRAIRIFDLY